MTKKILEIHVNQLRRGLYVSRLDRPWIGTTFLFQGFEVSTSDEIEQLRQLCDSVFVEVTTAEADELRKANGASNSIAQPTNNSGVHLVDLPQNLSVRTGRVSPKDPVALKAELGRAKVAYADAQQTVSAIFDRVRRGGSLDVSALQDVVASMVDSVFRNREAMSWLARMKTKDDYLYNHSLATSVWAMAFGRHLGLDKNLLRGVGSGAMLLDIGKTELPLELLQNAGKPAPDEWSRLRTHVELGLQLVADDPKTDSLVKMMIGTHHERIDGSGYPHGLKGDSIPLVGRIAGIVDCYDAMTSHRQYQKAKSTHDAVRELKSLSGSWFPAELIELFIQAVGIFPTGTLVELNTGEVGVVIAQNHYRRLRPQIMVILDADKKLSAEFSTVDLQLCEANSTAGKPELWITRGLEPGAYGIDPMEYFL